MDFELFADGFALGIVHSKKTGLYEQMEIVSFLSFLSNNRVKFNIKFSF